MAVHSKLPLNKTETDQKLEVSVQEEPGTPSSSTTLASSDPFLWDAHIPPRETKAASPPADYSARQWSSAKKTFVSLVAVASFFVIALTTSVYIAGIPEIRAEFHIGSTLAISPVTLYAAGFIIGPLLSSTLSEEFGRQWGSNALCFYIWSSPRRWCNGLKLSNAGVTIFAGVLNGIWKMPEDRLTVPVFLLYGLGGIAAQIVGPITGESIVEVGGWRWTFWLIAVLVSACFLATLWIGETYEPEVRRKALGLSRRGWRKFIDPAFLRPFHML
ncbi:MFS general substrate transporter [Penicillium antarcticum]|uniref:MFS general substrate transporter n=1 Tax=Penicillium antarcticum TaxID=416450 RepID=UPI0023A04BB4|nr:MFS general substrate transporter [Penicillium antarcticum]KAJ5288352.1 MFS general substrate transporter [Penicillium antarcticum]